MKPCEQNKITLPTIHDADIALLEKLSNAVSVSGAEHEIRQIIREEIGSIADEIKVDALGNLIAVKKSSQPGALRVMIAAHMDEVGFMLVDKESDGIFRFSVVGGIDPRSLAGKAVQVGKDHAPGVIGACPVHLSSRAEREQIMRVDSLRIDTGTGSSSVNVGDYGTFSTRFKRMGANTLMGKALDNRIGVATLIQLFKNAPSQIELIAAFTVQEEVGLRGAATAAWQIMPDFAFVIDCTPANDQIPYDGSENVQYRTKLGGGPAIYTNDSRTLYDHRLIRFMTGLAKEYGIPYQFRQPAPGGTDAGAIHIAKGGIPTLSMSVPGRYAHTAALMVRRTDWEHHLQLMTAALQTISAEILKEDR